MWTVFIFWAILSFDMCVVLIKRKSAMKWVENGAWVASEALNLLWEKYSLFAFILLWGLYLLKTTATPG